VPWSVEGQSSLRRYGVKRLSPLVAVLALILSGPLVPVSAQPRAKLRIEPLLTCADGGGAHLVLTVANEGGRQVVIDPDLHIVLEIAGRHGRRPGVIIFLFPARGWDRVPPGEERTFLVDLGTPFEGEPGIDLSGARLFLEVQVWLRGFEAPWERVTTFAACNEL
jgi:hypothetical protein